MIRLVANCATTELFSVAAGIFALAVMVGAAFTVMLVLSLFVRRIGRKFALYGFAGASTVAFIAFVMAALTVPPTTMAKSVAAVNARATPHLRPTQRTKPEASPPDTGDIYSGEPRGILWASRSRSSVLRVNATFATRLSNKRSLTFQPNMLSQITTTSAPSA